MSQCVLGDNNDLRSEAAPVPSDGFCGVIEEREVQRDSVVSVGLLLCQSDPAGIGLDGGGVALSLDLTQLVLGLTGGHSHLLCSSASVLPHHCDTLPGDIC